MCGKVVSEESSPANIDKNIGTLKTEEEGDLTPRSVTQTKRRW